MEDHSVTESTMADVLRRQAQTLGDHPFLLFDDRIFSYAQSDALVDSYARGLLALGVDEGTHVGIMMENGPEFLWLWLATARLGAVSVPINTAYKSGYLRHVLDQAEVEILAIDGVLADRAAAVDSELERLRDVVILGDENPAFTRARVHRFADLPRTGGDPVERVVPPGAMATILYTSGTTGPSKGAMLSHTYWYDATVSSNDRRDIRPDDVFYVSSPMFHAAAWVVCLYSALTTGLPVGLDRRFSVSDFWNRARHYGATQFFTMSAMHMWLLNAPPIENDRDNPARVWGPVPLPPDLHQKFKERFGIEHLWFTYGQTEALMITCTDTRRPFKPGSAGWARDGVELAVVDDDDNLLPPDTPGELVARPVTPNTLMSGYWNNPEASLRAFRNLWYHTGDIARIDEDGEVFFLDRKADYLRVRGENVSSFEVEATVAGHPEVEEVAAYAIAAEPGSEDEVMIAVRRSMGSTLTERELAEYCIEHLPYFAVPRFIEFVADFPRTPTNRVQKYQLRDKGLTGAVWDRVAAGLKVSR